MVPADPSEPSSIQVEVWQVSEDHLEGRDEVDEGDELLIKEIDDLLKKEPIEENEDLSRFGFPLELFRNDPKHSSVSFCHPYLSLTYLDVLSDEGNKKRRSFLVGATNQLFKTKKGLFDVIIDCSDGKIEILSPELKKQLSLTTEDLRFADHLVKSVQEQEKGEKQDEWIRYQFKLYLLHMIRTITASSSAASSSTSSTSSSSSSASLIQSFNSSFISAWMETENYSRWLSHGPYLGFENIPTGHPRTGQLSMSDMKLRFSHSVLGSERTKKFNQTLTSANQAISSAKSAVVSGVSSWWANRGATSAQSSSSPVNSIAESLSSFTLSNLLKSVEKEDEECSSPH